MSIYQPVNWTTVATLAAAWLAAQVILSRRGPRSATPE
jgi:hypothetical protein